MTPTYRRRLGMQMMRSILFFSLIFLFSGLPLECFAAAPSRLDPLTLIGEKDALLLADLEGNILLSKNKIRPMVPASVLKIFTAHLALTHLGPDHRFATDFYLDNQNRLKVKGFGDPFFVSESLAVVAQTLSRRIHTLDGIVLDDTYFADPLTIPGVSDSFEPFDAPNGALCVNFNTVNFRRTGSKFVTAEPQTPLLPMVIPRILKSGLDKGRIVLSHQQAETVLYAGHLLEHFLEKAGITVTGEIRRGRVNPTVDSLVLHHVSEYRLTDIVSQLLEHSNNFIANQLLISVGAAVLGPPGTLDKGVRAARNHAAHVLNIDGI
ncbi:MAG: D-alanyl-D-alanine carboxypeptidase, partial [Deltaproteobacteria bacterium]|nr:D-alanyl-D-alanine carboxypeptidase [Deltaproteobacteria bacterium]